MRKPITAQQLKSDEDRFINGASSNQPAEPTAKPSKAKTFPQTFSMTDDQVREIDRQRTNCALSGYVGVKKTDIIRAALVALSRMSDDEAVALVNETKK